MPESLSSNASIPKTGYRRLAALGPLGLKEQSCLHLHKTWVHCRRCQEACPHSCIRLETGSLALDPTRCTGCGRCASVCPAEALAVDGFALGDLGNPLEIVIACRKQESPVQGSLVVPCFAGLTELSLARLLGRYPGAKIRLTDVGACAQCPGEAGTESALRRLAVSLQELLAACGQDRGRVQVEAVRTSLPNGNGTKTMSTDPVAGRRAFFSSLGRSLTQAVVKQGAGALPLHDSALQPKRPRDAIPYDGGYETRLLMEQMAAPSGQQPGRARLAKVTVSEACQAHGACSRLCPTGALGTHRVGNAQILDFDPWLCIDCGACVGACPERALRYETPEWRNFEVSRVPVSRVGQRECGRCGGLYAVDGETDLCPACGKSVTLSQSGFALFAEMRGPPAETGPP